MRRGGQSVSCQCGEGRGVPVHRCGHLADARVCVERLFALRAWCVLVYGLCHRRQT